MCETEAQFLGQEEGKEIIYWTNRFKQNEN